VPGFCLYGFCTGSSLTAYSTVGFEKELIKKYIRHQEILDAKGYDDELDKGEKDKDDE